MLVRNWEYILAHKDWIFSGIGVFALTIAGTILRFVLCRIHSNQAEPASAQSFRAGRDVNITVGDKSPDAKTPRQQFLYDLINFCAESKAATTRLYLAKSGEGSPEKLRTAIVAAFSSCEQQDAAKQHLQLRAKDTFSSSKVSTELFEFLRRTSLARVSLGVMETAYLTDGFLADQAWVDSQKRRLITVTAQAAGYDLGRGETPFLIGFHPSFVSDDPKQDLDGQPPSTQNQYEYELQKLRKEWEAQGHKWDPSVFPSRSTAARPRRKRTPGEVPRRDSSPDISDGRPHSGIPCEETHLIWLNGYDARPALVFADGVSAQIAVRLTTSLSNPMKAFAAFQQSFHPIDAISPRIAEFTDELLEAQSSSAFTAVSILDFDARYAAPIRAHALGSESTVHLLASSRIGSMGESLSVVPPWRLRFNIGCAAPPS